MCTELFDNQGTELVDFVIERIDLSELTNDGDKKSHKLEKQVTKLKKKMALELNKITLFHHKDAKKKDKIIVKLKNRNDALEKYSSDL